MNTIDDSTEVVGEKMHFDLSGPLKDATGFKQEGVSGALCAIRTVELKGISLPVRVAHAHLDTSQRLDAKTSRIDILDIGVYCQVDYSEMKSRSFAGLWNYQQVYAALCDSDVPTLEGPLESILDMAMDVLVASAQKQGVHILFAEITAKRKGLSVGCPVLKRSRGVPAGWSEVRGADRSVGICGYPLSLAIDHSWADKDTEQVEHQDVRKETVVIDFEATFKAGTLADRSLKGLLNYVSTIESLDEYQHKTVDEPTEIVAEMVRKALESEAAKESVQLHSLSVNVTRQGYARFVPTLGLRLVY